MSSKIEDLKAILLLEIQAYLDAGGKLIYNGFGYSAETGYCILNALSYQKKHKPALSSCENVSLFLWNTYKLNFTNTEVSAFWRGYDLDRFSTETDPMFFLGQEIHEHFKAHIQLTWTA